MWPAIRHERRSVLESLQPAAIHTYVSTIAGRAVRGACLKVSSQMDVFASLNSSAHRFAVLSWAAVSAAVASSRRSPLPELLGHRRAPAEWSYVICRRRVLDKHLLSQRREADWSLVDASFCLQLFVPGHQLPPAQRAMRYFVQTTRRRDRSSALSKLR